ncbi:MAG: polysaccharide biosynthesis/export family protein [Muribaculaceae bacterium]|nr:polysaccharide biosynthesis/export family protein [Muribaculaceae bacterium]
MLSCKSFFKSIGVVGAMLLGLTSCHTPKDITYFQDLSDGARREVSAPKELVVTPDDRLSITVHSKDPQLAMLFNLPISSTRIGSNSTSNSSGQVAVYAVDAYGDIEFPVLGTLHIGGMKRTEVAEYVKRELLQRNLVKDPTVVVDFLNRSVNVLGEVAHPGKVSIDRDRFTILDAIAGAGDLTIQGKRANVIVLRMEDGRQVAHTVDLTDATATLNSPVYYLQQNDVIYVEPTDVRKRQTTANGNSVFTPSFWISIASFATTVLLLIKNW